ncbi:hypothetical protein [Shewanella sp.]|uniref:hypothetical protein n=1 Tax=Shewanella sp. TaxID=50422 RepID=UPI003D138E7C
MFKIKGPEESTVEFIKEMLKQLLSSILFIGPYFIGLLLIRGDKAVIDFMQKLKYEEFWLYSFCYGTLFGSLLTLAVSQSSATAFPSWVTKVTSFLFKYSGDVWSSAYWLMAGIICCVVPVAAYLECTGVDVGLPFGAYIVFLGFALACICIRTIFFQIKNHLLKQVDV